MIDVMPAIATVAHTAAVSIQQAGKFHAVILGQKELQRALLQFSQIVDPFGIFSRSPLLQHITGELRTLPTVLLIFLRIALV